MKDNQLTFRQLAKKYLPQEVYQALIDEYEHKKKHDNVIYDLDSVFKGVHGNPLRLIIYFEFNWLESIKGNDFWSDVYNNLIKDKEYYIKRGLIKKSDPDNYPIFYIEE